MAISQFHFFRGMTGWWSDASGILKFHPMCMKMWNCTHACTNTQNQQLSGVSTALMYTMMNDNAATCIVPSNLLFKCLYQTMVLTGSSLKIYQAHPQVLCHHKAQTHQTARSSHLGLSNFPVLNYADLGRGGMAGGP